MECKGIWNKVLMALQQFSEIRCVCLGDVSEFDETFVLDCYITLLPHLQTNTMYFS